MALNPRITSSPYGQWLLRGVFAATALALLLWVKMPWIPPWPREVSRQQWQGLQALQRRTTTSALQRWKRRVAPYDQLATTLDVAAGPPRARVRAQALDRPLRIPLRPAKRASTAVRAAIAPWEGAGSPLARAHALGGASREPPQASSTRRLDGLRIVLDPGHYGGAWSRIEDRHIALDSGPPVREGNLTYATARLLQKRLQRAGAEVRLTRGAPPESPFATPHPGFAPRREAALVLRQRSGRWPYAGWFATYPAPWPYWQLSARVESLVARRMFYLFTRHDLRRRIRVAERFEGDLLLSLHYNTTRRSRANGIILFMPGNFLVGELNTDSERFYAVRHLLSGHLDATAALARAIGHQMQATMQLPALGQQKAPDRPRARFKLPIDADAGVYARNLAVLRRAPGIALLIEGPCMNHRDEYARLREPVGAIDGLPYPDRAVQYADAVARAVRQHAHLLRDHRSPRQNAAERGKRGRTQ